MSVDQDALDILCEVFDDRIEDVMSNRDNLSYTLYDDDGYPVVLLSLTSSSLAIMSDMSTSTGLGCATVV